ATFTGVRLTAPVALANPGFERGIPVGWSASPGTGVNMAARHGGWYDGYNAGGRAGLTHVVAIQPGATYTLRVWARLAAAAPGTTHAIFTSLDGGATRTRAWITSTTYTEITLTFTAGPGQTSLLFGSEEVAGSNVVAYFDDFSLERVL